MENKSGSNTTVLIVIALAVLLIVAMICGMGIWMMQRTMSFNERLLETRLEEARTQNRPAQALPAAPAVSEETLRAREALARAEAEAAEAKRQLEALRARQSAAPAAVPEAPVSPAVPAPDRKPAAPAAGLPAAQPSAQPAARPAAQPAAKPLRAKRAAPKELPSAAVGPDGRPKNRVILNVGGAETEWQL